jgi:hypothetical protein
MRRDGRGAMLAVFRGEEPRTAARQTYEARAGAQGQRSTGLRGRDEFAEGGETPCGPGGSEGAELIVQ